MLKLPPKMEEVLLLIHGRGLKEVDAARELGVSKQAVSKAVREGRGRLTQLFLSLAETLNADIVRVSLDRGYAVLKLRQLGARAYAFYVPGKGIRVLFGGEVDCRGENSRLCSEVVEAARRWGLLKRVEGDLGKAVRDLLKAVEG